MRKLQRMGLVLALLLLVLAGCASQETPEASGKEEGQALAFPYVLEEGRLSVESVFQYSGMNPDSGNADGTDIAAMEVKNASVLHLERAELTLTLDDGTDIAFLVEDLPAGETAMVFARENTSMAPDSGAAIACKAAFTEETPLLADKVSVTVDGMNIQVTNRSDEELRDIKIYCHSVLEGACYGGRTYSYTIDSISTGAAESVEAADCYLDGAMVVRIEE